jgi:hypothetical protein
MESRLVFHHQDGELSFCIVRGAYNLSQSGELSCSVVCAPNDALDFMAAPHFALLRVPVGEGLYCGQTLAVNAEATSENILESRPLAHLYAGEHYSPLNTRLTVTSVGERSIGVHVSFITADPNYYDQRAKPTHVEFWATLEAGSPAAIWSPL